MSFSPKSSPRHKSSGKVKALARAYRCGHCNSVSRAEGNVINVSHSKGCPVLTGAASHIPDAIRAGHAAGYVTLVFLPPGGGTT